MKRRGSKQTGLCDLSFIFITEEEEEEEGSVSCGLVQLYKYINTYILP